LKKKGIILASSSPRRRYLLGMILNNFGLKFDIIPANIKECIPKKAKNYSVFVKKLALIKAKSIADSYGGVIIGADTIVVLNGRVLGKPATYSEAKRMLKLLSGKEHKVYTGIAIVDQEKKSSFVDYEVSKVRFRVLTNNEIDYYVKSESPMDKAGAYGIQDDFGSTFVSRISGDYFNIVGLPVVKTYLGLKKILNLRF
jgi:septum formation protein